LSGFRLGTIVGDDDGGNMVEAVAMVVVVLGGIAMVAIPAWALQKRQDALELRARREMAGTARLPLSPQERAVARRFQRKTYRVPPLAWALVPVFLLIGPIVAESHGTLGLLISVAALIGFILLIQRSPADESLAAALGDPGSSHSRSPRGSGKGLRTLPWFAKLDVLLGPLLLPAGAILLLTDHITVALIVLGLWVLHMGLLFPLISFKLGQRDRDARQSPSS
jgi:hypothetical protein